VKAFIDTNVLVYALERHPRYGEKARMILEKVDAGEVEGVISTLVLMEVCWYLEAGERLDAMAEAVERINRSRVNIVEVSGADVLEATRLKKTFKGVELNDLVNYAVMRRLGVDTVYTNDAHYGRLPDVKPLF
jgi:predicted nucleic acid-binding protein